MKDSFFKKPHKPCRIVFDSLCRFRCFGFFFPETSGKRSRCFQTLVCSTRARSTPDA